jgi:hypothetical protein
MGELWTTLTNSNVYICDENTVQALQGLAPGWNAADRSKIKSGFAKHELFSRVKDANERSSLLQKTLAVDGIIITFKTFHKHIRVLEPIMLNLRELFRPFKIQPSVAATFRGSYIRTSSEARQQQCVIQYSETENRALAFSEEDSAKYAYWQLWLFVLRHRHEISKDPAKEHAIIDDETAHGVPAWFIRLGYLAHTLGFHSDRITNLTRKDPDLCEIRRNLDVERPGMLFYVSPSDLEAEVESRHQGQTVFRLRSLTPQACISSDSASKQDELDIRLTLFLPSIWQALKQHRRQSLTRFGILVLQLFSFWGTTLQPNTPQSPTLESATLESTTLESNTLESTTFESTTLETTTLQPEHQNGFNSNRSSLEISIQPNMLTAESTVGSLSNYSFPRNSISDSSPRESTPTKQSITFWHLPNERTQAPVPTHSCPPQHIANVVSTLGDDVMFLSIRTKVFKVCHPARIEASLLKSDDAVSLYYISRQGNWAEWVGRTYQPQPWLEVDNPWRS